ncbi:MAG: DUF3568 family protein [Gemmatimonadota bacterium]
MEKMRRSGLVAVLLSAVAGTSGCLVAAAGSGAGGGVYFTSRGVQSVIAAPVENVATATDQTFDHFGIQQTELVVKKNGARREFTGKPARGDPEVVVTLRRKDATSTKVKVTARTGLVTWNKEYARDVIEKIVELSSG